MSVCVSKRDKEKGRERQKERHKKAQTIKTPTMLLENANNLHLCSNGCYLCTNKKKFFFRFHTFENTLQFKHNWTTGSSDDMLARAYTSICLLRLGIAWLSEFIQKRIVRRCGTNGLGSVVSVDDLLLESIASESRMSITTISK